MLLEAKDRECVQNERQLPCCLVALIDRCLTRHDHRSTYYSLYLAERVMSQQVNGEKRQKKDRGHCNHFYKSSTRDQDGRGRVGAVLIPQKHQEQKQGQKTGGIKIKLGKLNSVIASTTVQTHIVTKKINCGKHTKNKRKVLWLSAVHSVINFV